MPRKWRKRIVAAVILSGIFLVSRRDSHKGKETDQSQNGNNVSSTANPAPPSPASNNELAAPTGAPEDEPAKKSADAEIPSGPALVKREHATTSKDTAQLKVNSDPPNALVDIDGKPTGKRTPTELQLPRGRHSVSVRMSGFHTSSASFRVKGGEEIDYAPELTVAIPNVPVPGIGIPDLSKLGDLSKEGQRQSQFWQQWAQRRFGDGTKLVVNSSPLGARIFIDGQDSGQTSPAVIPEKPGTYHVRLELDGFEPIERDVTVGERKPGMMNPKMKFLHPER